MNKRFRYTFAGLVLFGLLLTGLLTVSTSRAESYGAQDRSCSWGTNFDQPNRIEGIDTASVNLIRLIAGPEEGVLVAFWTNSSKGFSGTSGARCYGPATSIGSVSGKDHSELKIHAETTDGKTGWVRIGESRYELDKGGLFLFDTSQKTPRVAQVKVNMNQIGKGFGMKNLMKFARSHSEIKNFWIAAKLP